MPTASEDAAARIDREREFHDDIFSSDAREPAAKFYAITRRRDEAFRARLGGEDLGAVLEYGCGPGSPSYLLPPPPGTKLTAIDLSPVAVEQAAQWARENGVSDVEFRVMNAEELEFDDSTFDLVTGRGILHHLDLGRAYSEIARVLRQDGRALFIEPLGHNPLINLYRQRTPAMRTVDEHPLLTKDLELANDFFEEVEFEFFHLASLAAAPLHRFSFFESALSALERVDEKLLAIPRLQRHAWYSIMDFRRPRK